MKIEAHYDYIAAMKKIDKIKVDKEDLSSSENLISSALIRNLC